jgi:hypothetical protein
VIAPSSELPVSYRVEIAWLGTDPDGSIRAYDWRISDDGPDGVVDVEDTLGLDWNRTVKSDSLFEASAELDSFPPDVDNPLITDPIDFRWWQNHTFWVRAVDQQGAVDPSPSSTSFTATTTAPKVEIDIPVDLPPGASVPDPQDCLRINPVLALGVQTIDLDDPLGFANEYRYALLAVEDLDPAAYSGSGITPLGPGECLGYDRFAQLDLLPWVPEQDWSEWMQFVDTDEPEIDLVLPVLDAGTSWFLLLQARDRAGALTPSLRYNQNFLEFVVEGGFSPRLTVTAPDESSHEFVGDVTPPVALMLVGDGNYRFDWSADAAEYAGLVIGYRYAVDPVDPFAVQESEWVAPWNPVRAATLSLVDGEHDLVIAAQDNSGAISYARFDLSITNSGN